MRTTSLLLVMFLFMIGTKLSAQISFKTEYFGASSYWHETGEDSREKIGDCKGSAIVYQGSINIPVLMKNTKYNRPSIWGVGISGSYAKLDNSNFTGVYDGMVIDEMLNGTFGISHMRPIGEKWNLIASIGVGLFTSTTDFSKMRGKELMGNGALIFVRQIKPNLELGGGIAVNNSFGYLMVFPAIYFNWNLEGKFDLKVSVVDGLEVGAGYNVSKFLDLSLIIEMSGQSAYVIKDNKEKIFSHQYFIAGLRPEIKLGNKVSIPITAGMHLVRSSFFSYRTLKGMFSNDDYYFQAAPYASVGLKIGF